MLRCRPNPAPICQPAPSGVLGFQLSQRPGPRGHAQGHCPCNSQSSRITGADGLCGLRPSPSPSLCSGSCGDSKSRGALWICGFLWSKRDRLDLRGPYLHLRHHRSCSGPNDPGLTPQDTPCWLGQGEEGRSAYIAGVLSVHGLGLHGGQDCPHGPMPSPPTQQAISCLSRSPLCWTQGHACHAELCSALGQSSWCFVLLRKNQPGPALLPGTPPSEGDPQQPAPSTSVTIPGVPWAHLSSALAAPV